MNNKVYTFEEIKAITKHIFEKYKIKKAYIFGSYAREEAKEISDIDIMIVKEIFYKEVQKDRRILYD